MRSHRPAWLAMLVASLIFFPALNGCSQVAAPEAGRPHEFARSFPFGFTPGERYSYSLTVTPTGEEPGESREGTIAIALESAGGADLTLSYRVELGGEETSGSLTDRFDNLVNTFHDQATDPMAEILGETVLALLWPLYFTDREFQTGLQWEVYTEVCCGGCLLEFTVGSETTVAGLRGFEGFWLAAGLERGRFCVSSEIPLPLSITLFTLTETYEAVLLGVEGFE